MKPIGLIFNQSTKKKQKKNEKYRYRKSSSEKTKIPVYECSPTCMYADKIAS